MRIDKIKKENYKELSTFLSRNFLPKKNINFYNQKFQLFWDNNPSFEDNDIRGLILFDNNEIKGCILNLLIDYCFGKDNIKVSCPSYWYVKKKI